MSKPAIEVRHISKKFAIGENQPYYSLRDSIVNFLHHPLQKRSHNNDFWALEDVSFSVEPGQALGILGANGAGKSTLLKIMSQITPPTQGEIILRGRVSSLLEVGTGFHPELTGRENIYLNGAILGMKQREIKRKFDEIVDFAEIEKFLDTPVKRYSSGMYTRLAFAVAAHLESEILLLDEVLAVGDAQFQKKCLGKMKEVQNNGRTIILISHSVTNIQAVADVGLFLNKGTTEGIVSTQRAIDQYLNKTGVDNGHFVANLSQTDYEARILEAKVLDQSGKTTDKFKVSQPITIEIVWENKIGRKVTPSIRLFNQIGAVVAMAMDTSADWDGSKKKTEGKYISRVTIPKNLLNANDYYVQLSLYCFSPNQIYQDEPNALHFSVWDPMDKNSVSRGAYRVAHDEVAIWPSWEWEWKYLGKS